MSKSPSDALASMKKPRTLIDLVRQRAEDAPEQGYRFLRDGVTVGESLTYHELDRDARRIGAALQTEGVQPRSPVLLVFAPGLEFVRAFFGCLYAGAIAVPVEPLSPLQLERTLLRIRMIAGDCRPTWLLTSSDLRKAAPAIIPLAPELASAKWIVTGRGSSTGPEDWSAGPTTGSDLALLQYTSGSTRQPHGVMLSHANLLHNQELIRTGFRHRYREFVGVTWLPVHHDMGLIGMVMQPLYLGGNCVLMAPADFLSTPFKWLAAISTFGATTSGAPNFAYELCAKKITEEQLQTLNLATWQVAFCGAEPVRASTLDRFAARFAPRGFKKASFVPCYGLAEASLLVSGTSRDHDPFVLAVDDAELRRKVVVPSTKDGARRLVGCGTVVGDQEVAIVDTRGSRVKPGRIGEIWLRGKSVGSGYWGNPGATKQSFGARLRGNGGPFLRTGDLGFVGDRGDLFIVGRVKDLIIVRGLNYYPSDIEATAEMSWRGLHPGCSAAFALEGEGTEAAVVICEHDGREIPGGVSWNLVVDAVRGRVAQEYGLSLDRVVIVSRGQIPKTSSGKIQRSLARSRYLEGALEVLYHWRAPDREADTPTVNPVLLRTESEIVAFIVTWLSVRLQQAVAPNSDFIAMGLDSLDVVMLMGDLGDSLGREATPRLALDYPSASALAAHLMQVGAR
jgi:acyl-CoA synthetase (AMP-forming)/AMP-acid ligase II/acyl carrier protein